MYGIILERMTLPMYTSLFWEIGGKKQQKKEKIQSVCLVTYHSFDLEGLWKETVILENFDGKRIVSGVDWTET